MASSVGTKSANTLVPPVVRTPLVQKLSLIAIGTPASGRSFPRPSATCWSTRRAAAIASSRVIVMKRRRASFSRPIRSRAAWVTSTAVSSRRRTASAIFRAVIVVRSIIGATPPR